MKYLLLTFILASSIFAKTFTFTAIPDQDETNLSLRFSKFASYLSQQLDIEVKFIAVKSYQASISAFRNKEVQLAWFGGLSGVRARLLVPNAKAIAQGFEDTKFRSYLIANTNTNLDFSPTFPKNIKGKTFLFGAKGSTSGRLMPEYYIRAYLKKKPQEIFTKVGFSNNHNKTIELVQSGAYDLGAVNFKVWEKEVKAGNIDTSKVKIIWKTPTYLDYHFTMQGDLDERYYKGFSEKLTNAILNLKDKNILDAFPRSKFIKANNSGYTHILNLARKIDLID